MKLELVQLFRELDFTSHVPSVIDIRDLINNTNNFSVRLPRGFTHLPIEQVFHEAFDDSVFPTPAQRNILVSDEATAWRFDTQQELSSASSSNGSANGSGSNGSTTEEYTIGAGEFYFDFSSDSATRETDT